MKSCPLCGSGAPDDATQCPICFASLDQAAGAAAQPPAAVPVPAAAPPDPPSEPAQGVSPLGIPLAPAPPPTGAGVPREEDYLPIPGIPGVDNIPKDAPPAYSPPAPAPPPIGLGGGPVRTTLAGDVIEESLPHNFGQPIPGAPMGPQSMRPSAPAPIPVARNRAASSRSRPASTEAPKSGGVPAFVILLIVLVLAGAGAGGWWYWQQKQAPAKAAGQFFESIQKKDWKSMYNLIELAPEQKAMATEEQFVAGMSMVGGMINIKKYEVGEATVTGDTAKVKVTVTASLNVPGMPGGDRTNTQEIPMKKVNGKWKLDATSARGGSMPGLGGLGGPGSGQ